MGEPILSPEDIPTKLLMNNLSVPNGKITINDQILNVYATSMGNNHMIVFVDKIDNAQMKAKAKQFISQNS